MPAPFLTVIRITNRRTSALYGIGAAGLIGISDSEHIDTVSMREDDVDVVMLVAKACVADDDRAEFLRRIGGADSRGGKSEGGEVAAIHDGCTTHSPTAVVLA